MHDVLGGEELRSQEIGLWVVGEWIMHTFWLWREKKKKLRGWFYVVVDCTCGLKREDNSEVNGEEVGHGILKKYCLE